MLTLTQRRVALAAVVAGVLLSHALLTRQVIQHLLHSTDDSLNIERMEAELVADMKLTAPPVVATLPAPAELPSLPVEAPAALPAASAASKPTPPARPASAAPQAEPPPTVASAPTLVADAASGANAASAPSAPETMASGPTFEWPKATRVTFKGEGFYRGPVHGTAQVNWVRQDNKYQVHVDFFVGPSFAPLASMRFTSEGVITPKGLAPTRFESVNKLLFKSATPKVVSFEEKELVLADGTRIERLPDVQDPASHIIQMAYEFMLDASELELGKTLTMSVADTRKLRQLVYDIDSMEILSTPMGQIETFKLRPRPIKTAKGDEITLDLWIAPALQYLPIRLFLRLNEQTYLDVLMDSPPQQSPADENDAPIDAPSKPKSVKIEF